MALIKIDPKFKWRKIMMIIIIEAAVVVLVEEMLCSMTHLI
jgi:hypothetical protein